MSIGTQLANKLSVKSFGWDKEALTKAVLASTENPVFLMRVLGSANGTKEYIGKQQPDGSQSENGRGFIGNFRCIGPDGTVINGAKLFLPKYIENMMAAALSGEDIEAVEFAFDIYAVYNKSSATMYEYSVNDLTGKSTGALDAMEEALAGLPMPTATPAIADKSAKA